MTETKMISEWLLSNKVTVDPITEFQQAKNRDTLKFKNNNISGRRKTHKQIIFELKF